MWGCFSSRVVRWALICLVAGIVGICCQSSSQRDSGICDYLLLLFVLFKLTADDATRLVTGKDENPSQTHSLLVRNCSRVELGRGGWGRNGQYKKMW